MEIITKTTKPIKLTGEETHVHFTSGMPFFWLLNNSDGTVLMSLYPDIEEGGDGVIEVLAGSSAGTMHGFYGTRRDLYLLGSGKVQIMGTYSADNPFKPAEKGGGNSNVIIGGLTYINGKTYDENGNVELLQDDIPDGMGAYQVNYKIQTGSISVNNNIPNVSFAIPYKSVPIVICNIKSGFSSNQFLSSVSLYSVSTTGFQPLSKVMNNLNNQQGDSGTVYWTAFGIV